MGLREYVVKRSIQCIATILIILILNFFIFRAMPGSPLMYLIENPKLAGGKASQVIDIFAHIYGLDRPIWEQFFIYIKNMLTWNFGYSFMTLTPIVPELKIRLLNTIILLGSATILAIILGMATGLFVAARRGKIVDKFSLIASMTLYSIPVFWLGLLLLLVFGYYLGLFPLFGMITPGAYYRNVLEYIVDFLHHLTLPMLTLTAIIFGGFALLMRSASLEVLAEDYVLTARAKGLSERKILRKYVARNALLPMVTVIALSLAGIVSGAILTETVFSWYGVGRWIFDSVMNHDYPVLEVTFYIITVVTVLANFIADMVYAYLDPRIKY